MWQTKEEFENELWTISAEEGVTNGFEEEPIPETIASHYARIAANNTGSIYDTPTAPHDEEGVTYIVSGRGRGGISWILRPGVSEVSDAVMTEDIKKKIHQVSGMCHSNEFLAQSVKAATNARNKNSPTTVQPSAKPIPITSKTSSPSKPFSPIEKETNPSSSSSNLTSLTSTEGVGPPLSLSKMREKADRDHKARKMRTKGLEEKAQEKNEPEKPKSPVAPCNRSNGWRRSPLSTSTSSSDETGCAWRRDTNSPNRFFQWNTPNGFHLNTEDFPALK